MNLRVIWRGSVYTVVDTREVYGEPWYLLRYYWHGTPGADSRWVPARFTRACAKA